MRNNMIDISERIRVLLDDRGQKQDDLALVLDLGEDTVSKLLNGKRGLDAGELATLCEHYGVSSDYLLFGAVKEKVGVLPRTDTQAPVARINESFENLRYVSALADEMLLTPRHPGEDRRFITELISSISNNPLPSPHNIWLLSTTKDKRVTKVLTNVLKKHYMSPYNQDAVYQALIGLKCIDNPPIDLFHAVAEHGTGSAKAAAIRYLQVWYSDRMLQSST